MITTIIISNFENNQCPILLYKVTTTASSIHLHLNYHNHQPRFKQYYKKLFINRAHSLRIFFSKNLKKVHKEFQLALRSTVEGIKKFILRFEASILLFQALRDIYIKF